MKKKNKHTKSREVKMNSKEARKFFKWIKVKDKVIPINKEGTMFWFENGKPKVI